MALDDVTKAPVEAVVWLQVTNTLAGQAIRSAVPRVTQTLSLLGPTVYHTLGKLIAGQELAGSCLVS
jgi:hypothetical protein